MLPRSLFSVEREKLEGYFAHKWGLSELLPMFHNYKNEPPLKGQALTLSGIPNKAGNYTVSVNGTNLWGMTEGNLTVIVDSILPEIQTLKPTQVDQLRQIYRLIYLKQAVLKPSTFLSMVRMNSLSM